MLPCRWARSYPRNSVPPPSAKNSPRPGAAPAHTTRPASRPVRPAGAAGPGVRPAEAVLPVEPDLLHLPVEGAVHAGDQVAEVGAVRGVRPADELLRPVRPDPQPGERRPGVPRVRVRRPP